MIHAQALVLLQDILCTINLLSESIYWITNSQARSHPIQHLANYHHHHPSVPWPIEIPLLPTKHSLISDLHPLPN